MLAGIVSPNILIFMKQRRFHEQSIMLFYCSSLAIVFLVFRVEGFSDQSSIYNTDTQIL